MNDQINQACDGRPASFMTVNENLFTTQLAMKPNNPQSEISNALSAFWNQTTCIIGSPGSGKSILAMYGIYPYLQDRFHETYIISTRDSDEYNLITDNVFHPDDFWYIAKQLKTSSKINKDKFLLIDDCLYQNSRFITEFIDILKHAQQYYITIVIISQLPPPSNSHIENLFVSTKDIQHSPETYYDRFYSDHFRNPESLKDTVCTLEPFHFIWTKAFQLQAPYQYIRLANTEYPSNLQLRFIANSISIPDKPAPLDFSLLLTGKNTYPCISKDDHLAELNLFLNKTTLILGHKATGKSVLARWGIYRCIQEEIHKLYIVSGSGLLDEYKQMTDKVFDADDFWYIAQQIKKDKDKKFLLIDDCLYQNSRFTKELADFIINGRHYNTTIVIISQVLPSFFNPHIRANINNTIIARERVQSLLKKYYDQFFSSSFNNFKLFETSVSNLMDYEFLCTTFKQIGTVRTEIAWSGSNPLRFIATPISIPAEQPDDQTDIVKQLTGIIDQLVALRNQLKRQ